MIVIGRGNKEAYEVERQKLTSQNKKNEIKKNQRLQFHLYRILI